ncbi:type II toxin-antitoxin system HicB family antitoxin [Selenomonas caprae]|uniref:Type II toxin-antitoxin system HicB family antitoxin n=1 Tax=Selenomonas caprae TaxID=2606905 RepID=A0A5D6WSI1_9FIRM|nr:type II toxin-antitoxin system HicB family antitoxin [Selenomonas caprae]TYZ30302.1 type II toxin-antitoxin system HicB family antitoxin [Selenomonas caprae]SFT35137.1 Predicted nuclease of the RNAse H fold, HicB family [Selenomonas ruminantium]
MERPNFYHYVAIMDYEDDGVHITFPDLPGCVSFGEDEADAVKQAREVLALHLWGIEDDGDVPPVPSTVKNLLHTNKLPENQTYFLVETFMPSIREKMANRVVKKTLTIPAWLNARAESYGINFSQTLQRALKQELNLV